MRKRLCHDKPQPRRDFCAFITFYVLVGRVCDCNWRAGDMSSSQSEPLTVSTLTISDSSSDSSSATANEQPSIHVHSVRDEAMLRHASLNNYVCKSCFDEPGKPFIKHSKASMHRKEKSPRIGTCLECYNKLRNKRRAASVKKPTHTDRTLVNEPHQTRSRAGTVQTTKSSLSLTVTSGCVTTDPTVVTLTNIASFFSHSVSSACVWNCCTYLLACVLSCSCRRRLPVSPSVNRRYTRTCRRKYSSRALLRSTNRTETFRTSE